MELFFIPYICLFQGPGSQMLSTQRPWPQPHPWAQIPVATNPPDISAETVKPTPSLVGTTVNLKATTSSSLPRTHHHHNHRTDGRMHTIDQLFLSRLRNRYRQVREAKFGRWPKLHFMFFYRVNTADRKMSHLTFAVL